MDDNSVNAKLFQLKRKYKKRHCDLFDKHAKCKDIHIQQELHNISRKSGNQFSLGLLQNYHKEQTIELINYAFSSFSDDMRCLTLEPNVSEYSSGFVDNYLDDCRSVVIFDKYNRICAIRCYEDMCDSEPILSDAQTKNGELYQFVERQLYATVDKHRRNDEKENYIGNDIPSAIAEHPLLHTIHHKQYENEEHLVSIYGRYQCCKVSAVRPDCYHLGLGAVLTKMCTKITYDLGYRFTVIWASNPIILRRLKRDANPYTKCLVLYNYAKHVFADGTPMSDFVHGVQQKYDYSEQFLSDFEQMSILSVWIKAIIIHPKASKL